MTENVKSVLHRFRVKPYMVRMGANKLAKRLKVTANDINEARRLFHSVAHHNVRILFLDIETSPLLAWVWNRWRENIYLDQTILEWFMLSWSGKWLNDDNTFGYVLTPGEVANEDDSRIVKELHRILDLADIVIAHNGKKFDIPKINTRFIINGLNPPSPYKQIDTLEVARKQFGFSSNSLDALATFFGFDNKDPHDFILWKSCLNGDVLALERMLKYNKKDVEILEQIYLKLRPWIKGHPNINVIAESECCPHCGNTDIEQDGGYYNTQHYRYPTYRCNHCNAVFRSKKRKSLKQNITSI